VSAVRVIALSGGVGGAKLAHGLSHVVPGDALAILVNTGDDFRHLNLPISPDLDSVTYALAGLDDRARGWGRGQESWAFMAALRELGGPDWFNLGDRDLAMHVWRGTRLAAGETLSTVTASVAETLGIAARLWPMSDDPVATIVETDQGALAFQDYFVARRCMPRVTGLRFAGAGDARPLPALARAIDAGAVEAIIICPSNPWLSIDPILAVSGMRALLRRAGAPIVAVSPIVGGAAVKGPTAKIMAELGLSVDHAAIAAHYRGLIDGLVIDDGDVATGLDLPVLKVPTLMRDDADRVRLAQDTLDFARALRRDGGTR